MTCWGMGDGGWGMGDGGPASVMARADPSSILLRRAARRIILLLPCLTPLVQAQGFTGAGANYGRAWRPDGQGGYDGVGGNYGKAWRRP